MQSEWSEMMVGRHIIITNLVFYRSREYESHWLIFLTWGMIMTTALQFSIYDMCQWYNNLNSTHTLNMIVYFCPFGLQSKLLQQTQMRWPS